MGAVHLPPDGMTDKEIRDILLNSKKIAVVGMSRDPEKAANFVPRYLMSSGYIVLPVNPTATEILGLKSYKSLLDLDVVVDVVDVFRPSDQVPEVAQQALKIRPKVFWMQEGIYNTEAVKLLRESGITTVWNRCMMREHIRLMRGRGP